MRDLLAFEGVDAMIETYAATGICTVGWRKAFNAPNKRFARVYTREHVTPINLPEPEMNGPGASAFLADFS